MHIFIFIVSEKVEVLSELVNPINITMQWHSQDIADARAQHGHTTFVRNSAQSAEAFRRSGTCSVSVHSELMRLEFCGYT